MLQLLPRCTLFFEASGISKAVDKTSTRTITRIHNLTFYHIAKKVGSSSIGHPTREFDCKVPHVGGADRFNGNSVASSIVLELKNDFKRLSRIELAIQKLSAVQAAARGG
ncbi:hypothetical protein ACP76Z_02610 [Vibrio cholerae]